jgi:hypothetical protein
MGVTTLATEGFETLTQSLVDAMEASNVRNKPVYFKASIPPHNSRLPLLIGDPLTYYGAVNHARNGRNIWKKYYSDAQQLAFSVSAMNDLNIDRNEIWKRLRSENHASSGCRNNFYYHHFHDIRRSGGHLFYGTDRIQGYNYCWHR